ncbi:uncharacterized protein G2W53_013702 [Senna tora]|uniref:Uncharacterized protein n=1 Tax=Senna tora TaxID=362788 RepID=A0A834U059_9FABA|nr:uncharacterized protein G2W53_013702 [Senna tora]
MAKSKTDTELWKTQRTFEA